MPQKYLERLFALSLLCGEHTTGDDVVFLNAITIKTCLEMFEFLTHCSDIKYFGDFLLGEEP